MATNLDFSYTLTLRTPFPSHRLALSALRAIQVDAELSPLVRRTLSLENTISSTEALGFADDPMIALRTEYRATTNRMLRVAVNGFMESLGVVLGIMESLDIDVLDA